MGRDLLETREGKVLVVGVLFCAVGGIAALMWMLYELSFML